MNPAEVAKAVDALTEIANVLDRLGIPGLVFLVLSGPALVLVAILAIEYHRSRKAQDMVETMRTETRAMLETYRADTQNILRELGANQDQTDQYYRDNVVLVQQYERVAKGLQDVVVGNTRAMERLITMLEERRKSG